MENITFDDFKKLDIRVAEIMEASVIEGADRIFKLRINLGSEEREIVAGIKQHYNAEELIGKKIAVLANLEPRFIRGINSHGMLLAASTEDKGQVTVLTPDRNIANGSKIA
ncbi:MAG: methionine--tRNA ligase subunit beta [Candidatus Margulisiibacteriota bacterium]